MKTLASTLALLLLATPALAKPKPKPKDKPAAASSPASPAQVDDKEVPPGAAKPADAKPGDPKAADKPSSDPLSAPPPAAAPAATAKPATDATLSPFDSPPPAPAASPAPAPTEEVVKEAPAKSDRGAFIIGLKAGGVFAQPFSKLGASFLVDVEVGYVLPFLNRGVALLIDAGYTQPTANGTTTDPRIDANGGTYTWDLTQRQILLGLTLMYRATFIGEGKLVPYIGAGPRAWLLQTRVVGEAGAGNRISETLEQSYQFGFHVPVGVDYLLGPGRIFLEAQLFWAPIQHRATGDSSVGSITAQLGYRLFI